MTLSLEVHRLLNVSCLSKLGGIVAQFDVEILPARLVHLMVGIDIVGPFVASEGNRYIIVATDYFTKWAETRAIPMQSAEETARFFIEKNLLSPRCPGRQYVAMVDNVRQSIGKAAAVTKLGGIVVQFDVEILPVRLVHLVQQVRRIDVVLD
jgi:hypothetical protein